MAKPGNKRQDVGFMKKTNRYSQNDHELDDMLCSEYHDLYLNTRVFDIGPLYAQSILELFQIR